MARPSLGSHTSSFLQHPIGYKNQSYSMWEEIVQTQEYQATRLTGAILEATTMKNYGIRR